MPENARPAYITSLVRHFVYYTFGTKESGGRAIYLKSIALTESREASAPEPKPCDRLHN